MNKQDEMQQNNMISNLPLLFANGYPTSLDKITESQLEKFIPFMVQCSLGHINVQFNNLLCSEPEWWPEDITFNVPFSKPKNFCGSNWMEKMKEIVIICYQFHKSIFLLRFCSDLASYEHASLRFINNYNSTTSLFDRRSNKLLVTFRNENMSYDQAFKQRKSLLQHKAKLIRGPQVSSEQQVMVESAPFDIYLCDNCDAELYSREAIVEHEKVCKNDDVVLLSDTSEPQMKIVNEDSESRKMFLSNFNLMCCDDDNFNNRILKEKSKPLVLCEENFALFLSKNRRLPKRNRTLHFLTRCPSIPISSPAGLHIVQCTKGLVSNEYVMERIDRLERFCSAPILAKNQNKPRYFERKGVSEPHCTYKSNEEHITNTQNITRVYTYPQKQYYKLHHDNFTLLNTVLIKRCKPISIRLRKVHSSSEKKSQNKNNTNPDFISEDSGNTEWNIVKPAESPTDILETIDLCSSEDEEAINNLSFFPDGLRLQNVQTTNTSHIRGIGNEISYPNQKSAVASILTEGNIKQSPKKHSFLNIFPKPIDNSFSNINSQFDMNNSTDSLRGKNTNNTNKKNERSNKSETRRSNTNKKANKRARASLPSPNTKSLTNKQANNNYDNDNVGRKKSMRMTLYENFTYNEQTFEKKSTETQQDNIEPQPPPTPPPPSLLSLQTLPSPSSPSSLASPAMILQNVFNNSDQLLQETKGKAKGKGRGRGRGRKSSSAQSQMKSENMDLYAQIQTQTMTSKEAAAALSIDLTF